nr:Truncated beta-galactosidase [Xanthomonas citri pv. citri]
MRRREFLAGSVCASSLLSAPALVSGAAAAGTRRVGTSAKPRPRPQGSATDAGGQWLDLDDGWRFHAGDVPFPRLLGQDETYANGKAGRAWGAAAPEFDDTGWRQLQVPHDFVLEQPVRADANVAQGYRPRGIAWYRRTFRLEEAVRDQAVELRLDGVASHATVWVNGMLMARSWSGYNGLVIDITPVARYGNALNCIAIRVDAEAMDGWWYEGGGIYRHTWLVLRAPLHIAGDGLAAVPREGPDDVWQVPVQLDLVNSGEQPADAWVEVVLRDTHGAVVAHGETQRRVAAFGTAQAALSIQCRSHSAGAWTPPCCIACKPKCAARMAAATVPHARSVFVACASTLITGFFSTDVRSRSRASACIRTMLASAWRCPMRCMCFVCSG